MRPGQSSLGTQAGEKEAILCRIPAFRPIVLKLLRVLGDDNASMSKVTELLNADPGMSAEILTAANSAAYGTARRISTTARAIVMLGTERTKALATKAALDAMLRDIGNHPTIGNCWSHSRATAVIAQWLAPSFRIHPDRAYTAGLMHDVGRLGLLSLDSRNYTLLLDTTGMTDEDVLEAERMMLKVDHCQAGAWLTRAWGFPDELQLAASQHHAHRDAVRDPGVGLARLSCAMAQALGYKAVPLVISSEIEDLLEEVPDLDRQDSAAWLATLGDRLEKELGDQGVQ